MTEAANVEVLLRIAEALEGISSSLSWIVFMLFIGWFVWGK